MITFLLIIFLGASIPDAPNYDLSENWAALPNMLDAADQVPENVGLSDNQKESNADVFYIHPTTFYKIGNAEIKNKALNRFTDKTAIKSQATVFNGSAKVYAPRYRQAALHNFFRKKEDRSNEAFNIAYSDVKNAFEYYLKHYNEGRPIIIAGHSQGSMHAKRLLKEFFDAKPLMKQLIAAYLVGYVVEERTYIAIPVCDSATQTGCIISYNTFGWEAQPKYYENSVCVNPLSWKNDEEFVGYTSHEGAVPRNFNRVDKNLIGCQCNDGVLWITKPKKMGYEHLAGKSYHIFDFHLFYLNIRKNVKQRVESFLKK